MLRVLNQKILPFIAYPSVIFIGLFMQSTILNSGAGLQISTYIAILLGVICIVLLEWSIPYRDEWRPTVEEVKTDAIFAILVQIVLPKILGFLVAITLLNYLPAHGLTIQYIWPHEAPLIIQVVLMMVSAEFLRYWLHRAAHSWSFLWRLHAVHHSPDKLYWLNTTRFHPFEKAIQFLFDALPFIVLGVNAEVLSVYFVFYALNGFFQHSNINLRMGLLNYIISSAELHRWHHSEEAKISGQNYGNNLIIWDMLFGSRYLPKDRQVGELGLINKSYPKSFFEQMKTPTTPGVDKYPMPLLGVIDIYSNLRTQTGILIAQLIYRLPFEYSLSDPMKYQYKLLMKIIHENKYTEYGIQHKFSQITSALDYIKQVPIQDYEDLRPFIETQERTKAPCLTQEQPQYYAMTSGTTGVPKHIPVLTKTIRQYQRALAIFACVQNKVIRHAFAGKLLAIPGPYHEGELDGGTTYGSISGLMYYLMPQYLQNKYVVPNSVFGLKDHRLKYRLIMRLAIQHVSISYMVTANPSTFLKLIEILNDDITLFANDIGSGTFTDMEQLPYDVTQSISKYLIRDEARSQELINLTKLNRPLSFSDIWPNLRLVVTWMGGSCGVAITSLKKALPTDSHIIDLGYLASELRGTITFEDTGSSGVPTFKDVFYEFIEANDYECGQRQTITLNQLQNGKQYYVIITSSAGLYRYFMNDIIEVTGIKKGTPLIRFVQKGKGVTNITGEKLAEQQLMTAVEALNVELNLKVPFYLCLTSVHDSRYELYIEGELNVGNYAVLLDDKLSTLNTEYASKRASGRLNQIIVKRVKTRTGEAFNAFNLSKGLRESQFKYLLLQNGGDCTFPFNEYRV